jgi:hypothetical protein
LASGRTESPFRSADLRGSLIVLFTGLCGRRSAAAAAGEGSDELAGGVAVEVGRGVHDRTGAFVQMQSAMR